MQSDPRQTDKKKHARRKSGIKMEKKTEGQLDPDSDSLPVWNNSRLVR